jgi:hypothetical protein
LGLTNPKIPNIFVALIPHTRLSLRIAAFAVATTGRTIYVGLMAHLFSIPA